MNMEKFTLDPLQDKFNKKLENSGMEFATENKNRFLSPEEWFAKYYNEKGDDAIPERIINEINPEELASLKEKYGTKKPAEADQLEIDF